MAGGYRHIVKENGNLESNEVIAETLDNFGDMIETIQQMYGMIWWLASRAAPRVNPSSMIIAVDEAQNNYELGLRIAQGVNRP